MSSHRKYYSRPSNADPRNWAKITPTAEKQLEQLLRTRGIWSTAAALGASVTTLEKARSGHVLKAEAAARLSAALERLA